MTVTKVKQSTSAVKQSIVKILFIIFIILGLFIPIKINVQAASLDDVIGATNQADQTNQTDQADQTSNEFMDSLKDATKLDVNVKGTDVVNGWIKLIAANIVKVASYFLIAFLVVRILLDMVYISLPFTRVKLSNGQAVNSQAAPGMMQGQSQNQQQPQMQAQQPQMQMQGQQHGIQWISTAAMMAVANEQQTGQTAIKSYIKDMVMVLVLTPILLVLAMSGVLSDLGFILGGLLENIISNISL